MSGQYLLLSAVVLFAGAVNSATIHDAASCVAYPCLVFDEPFDELDHTAWQHENTASGGGNWEFQYYTNNRSNSYVRDGILYIKPTLTTDKYGDAFITSGTLELYGGAPASECTNPAFWGCSRTGSPDNPINPIQSARLRTVKSFGLRYGRVEVRAKMPKGDWIWPAIWMMPTHEGYGAWPASGEIDLVESRGNQYLADPQGNHKGYNSAGATMHWGPFWPENGFEKTHNDVLNDFADNFHMFGLEWDENSLQLKIDDAVVVNAVPGPGGFWDMGAWGLPAESNPWSTAKNVRLAPFDQPFYFILNVAVGGTNGFFPDDWTNGPNGPKPWTNPSGFAFRDFWNARGAWLPTWNGEQAAMQVDYIRAWKLKADP